MGLFSFVIKVGIAAYAIDWVHRKYESHGSFYNHYRHKTIEDAANDAIKSAEETAPKVGQWLNDAWKQRHCHTSGRFNRFQRTPEISSTDLPNGRVSLEIDVPGLRKEDMVVSVNEHEGVVIVKGAAAADAALGLRERSVEARIGLPRNADVSDLKAKMDNGVLRVDVGKKEFEGKRVLIE